MNKSVALLALTSLSLSSCIKEKETRPNILLILADDMGYSDLGSFGGEMNTYNLDRLAHNGVRFTQFYNTARCCPSRASLMTGLYPHESGVGYMSDLNVSPGYRGYLNDSCATIAEVLGDAGYFTAMVGKWHIGSLKKAWPENRGFQKFFGIHHWIDSYYGVLDDSEIYEDGRMVIPVTDNPELYAENGKEWYTTDVFTTKAMEYMDEAQAEGKPFFQYLAYNAPHWPLHAPKEVVEKYIGMYKNGYEALRKEKYEQMIQTGIISSDWELPPQTTPDWEKLSEDDRETLDFYRAIYAAQIEVLDQNIGRIVEHLKEKGMLDNTVIIFLSDNGCSAEPMNSDFGFYWNKNRKGNYDEWRKSPSRKGGSQGRVWSVTSNTPFRKNKRFTHEGGISAPLIVYWPDGITNTDRINNKASHLVDIMATCVDLGKAQYPESVKPMRGISLVPDLRGKESLPHDYIFWEHEGHGALRNAKWKIVNLHAKDATSWELYDMEKDRTEMHDLSDKYPEIRQQMIKKWTEMAYDTNVLPWPDWSTKTYNPVEK
ncbi:arylsulfatase [Saccharicrinis sp. FJH2]|uniref:arylsulfatase n=1 Tax=Saccharicrinis sp. FJH65 TaxID=3344659 RepID=UPI0035F31ADA